MKYKKAAILLHIKIAEHLGEYKKELKSLSEQLLSDEETAARLQAEVDYLPNIDEKIDNSFVKLLEEKETLQQELDNLENQEGTDADKITYKMLQIDQSISQIEARRNSAKANAYKNIAALKEINETIKATHDRIDVLEEKIGTTEILKDQSSSYIKEDDIIMVHKGAPLSNNIGYQVKRLNKAILQAERDLKQAIAEKISNNPKLTKRYDIAIKGLESLPDDKNNPEIIKQQYEYNKELDIVIALAEKPIVNQFEATSDMPEHETVRITDEKNTIKSLQDKIATLKMQRKLGNKAENDKLNIILDIDNAEYQNNPLKQSVIYSMFKDYFKTYRKYFVPVISRSVINQFKEWITSDPEFTDQFFYQEDAEITAQKSLTIVDEDKQKGMYEIDEQQIKKEISKYVRGEVGSSNSIQDVILEEVLPIFMHPKEAKEYFQENIPLSEHPIQQDAKTMFMEYFFNPAAAIKPAAEIGMPATEIIARATNEIKKFLLPLKPSASDAEEVPTEISKFNMPNEKTLAYTAFKSLMGEEQSILLLKDFIKDIYLSKLNSDDVEFNTWQKNIIIGQSVTEDFQDKLTKSKEITDINNKYEKAMKFIADNITSLKADDEVKNKLKIKELENEFKRLMKRKFEKIEALHGLNVQQQLAMKTLMGPGLVQKELIGGREKRTDPRITIRLVMIFLPNYNAVFNVSVTTPLNANRDAGNMEFVIRKIGKKEPNTGNIKIELNTSATKPLLRTTERNGQTVELPNNVGQSANIRSNFIKELKPLQKKYPKLSSKELIKKFKNKIIIKIKREIYGDNYGLLEDVFEDSSGKETKGHPAFQDIRKYYENEFKKQLEELSAER